MRLSKIKLAGFKSFVDPTTIPLPSNLVGVVGPNGCGKSNVIDAIRWVMGETSAKHLRGDSMEDVIFNGSSSRKPVGTASIELFFDNSDGSIGGQYASYAEISIRRVVSRDGTSQYFLNNTRCRRKDITGLFLGTGLGPRSYAIIEQGMVSRLVEARPEEMRTYIEEAAGISKYKERRRETENRMNHTRENLDRLNDLRDEVEKQLKHLQRQAQVAEKYKLLKQQERQLEAELLAIRLAELDQSLGESRADLSTRQTELEAVLAGQREVEAAIESARAKHVEASDAFSAAQATFYGVQGEISRLEQMLAHTRELRTRQQDDLAEARAQLEAVDAEIGRDSSQLDELERGMAGFEPELAAAQAAGSASSGALAAMQSALDAWQERWHGFNLGVREHQRIREVEQTRLEHLKAHQERLHRQLDSVEGERRSISVVDLEAQVVARQKLEGEAAAALQAETTALGDVIGRLAREREAEQRLGADIEQLRGELESRRGSLDTLRAVQRAALADDAEVLEGWLSRNGLDGDQRLVKDLEVAEPWSKAVEVVLGDFLQAVFVDDAAAFAGSLPDTSLVLLDRTAAGQAGEGPAEGTLAGQVRNAGRLRAVLASVYCATSLEDANRRCVHLREHESVITPDGIWLGRGWVRVSRGQRYAGTIGREQEIRELAEAVADHEMRIAGLTSTRLEARSTIDALEARRVECQARLGELSRDVHEARASLSGLAQELDRARQRLQVLGNDSETVRGELESVAGIVAEAEERLVEAEGALAGLQEQEPAFKAEHETLLADFGAARLQADADRERVARIKIDFESRRAARDAARSALERVRSQHGQLNERIDTLGRQIAAADEPLAASQAELDVQLGRQAEVQQELRERREELEAVELAVKTDEGRRGELQRKVTSQRELVDSLRMHVRELEVRRESFAERFAATTLVLEDVTAQLPAEAVAEEWDRRLTQVRGSIERLGSINLAAIDEFSEQSERKTYLDSQHQDLSAALDTLDQAIRKIDRETRTRFQETFDSINDGLKRLFPRLFGGGHAYLTLDGEDLLNAGVTVMARPPGKRNSHIHLLSGGEKALTAVALIFSIFELNPAPFCLLDEVDAPLDEANVGRFCDIVKDMSKTVQFIVITHNKTTMEIASQLTGVTMNEPGVSRLVAVDIDEAVKLAAS